MYSFWIKIGFFPKKSEQIQIFLSSYPECLHSWFSIHLHEFFKEFSMNCVDFSLYIGIVVDFLEILVNFTIFNGFLEMKILKIK
jgi:hypothetical protein